MDEKKIFSTRLNDPLVKALKHLAIDLDKNISDLLAEAIQDLLKKYEKKIQQTKSKG